MIHESSKRIAKRIAETSETPFYFFDLNEMHRAFNELKNAFSTRFAKCTIAYSYKTNSTPAVTQLFRDLGAKAEVVTGMELAFALSDKHQGSSIYFDGPLKQESELRMALKNDVKIQIDSLEELHDVIRISEELGKNPYFSFRLSVPYHDRGRSRFGMNNEEFRIALEQLNSNGRKLSGIHFHVGSNIPTPSGYARSISTLKTQFELFKKQLDGSSDYWIDIGGGFPARSVSKGGRTHSISQYADAIQNSLSEVGFSNPEHIVIEPVRYLVEDFGYLVGRVQHLKNREKTILVSDVGLHHVRSNHNWYHPVSFCDETPDASEPYDIYGYNCFESDLIGSNILGKPGIERGDLFLVGSAGGYDIPSANVWTRPAPPIYGVTGEQITLIRQPQTLIQTRSNLVGEFFVQESFPKNVRDNLVLSPPDTNRGEDIFRCVNQNRKYLREHLPWLDSTKDIKDSEDFLKLSYMNNAKNHSLTLMILHENEFIGMCGFHEIDWLKRETSLGYWIREDKQSLGIATASVRTLLHHAFTHLGMERIFLRCGTNNTRSQKLARRLEFEFRQTLIKNEWLYDHHVDHHEYVLRNPQSSGLHNLE